ncbi:MAG: acetylxylan esterase [Bryobacteraceae bacterium]
MKFARTAAFALVAACLHSADFGDARNLSTAHTATHFASFPYRDAAEWNVRREALRKQILVSAGLWPLAARRPVLASRSGRIERDSFRIETVAFETLPGFFLHGNLYAPSRGRGPHPAVLVPHGHWKHGRIHHEADYSVPALCTNLARQGYVVFAWDMLGYNDSTLLPHEFGDTPAEQLWSFSPLGVQLWNSIRAVDFISSLPEVDTQRIAVTGASGGGTQTILLAAVDDRIALSAPVDMVSATFQGDDACEMAPGLRVGTNNVEISALIAPKPLLLVSSTKDWTKRTPFVELPMAEAVYRLQAESPPVDNAHIQSKHNYNRQSREAVYRFFNRHLRAGGLMERDLIERALVDFEPRRLLASAGRGARSRDSGRIFAAWRESAVSAAAAMSPAELRDLLSVQIGAEWPSGVSVLEGGPGFVLQREGSGDRVPARWFPPKGDTVSIVVDSRGMDHSLVPSAHNPPSGALYVDVFQTGSAIANRSSHRKDHLTFHRSDDANRVQDVLTAIAFVSAGSVARIRLVCDDRASLWCLAAAAISPEPVTLNAEPPPAGSDTAKWLFIPGIERAGGVDTIRRLALSRGREERLVAAE